MNNVEKITKLTEQQRKEQELAEKHRNKAREHTELAEKHAKKAADLENQIKYQKGEEVYDRVNALQLTPDELHQVLRLLDNKAHLLDVARSMFSERTMVSDKIREDNNTYEEAEEQDIYDETPVFGDDGGADNDDMKGDMKDWSV